MNFLTQEVYPNISSFLRFEPTKSAKKLLILIIFVSGISVATWKPGGQEKF